VHYASRQGQRAASGAAPSRHIRGAAEAAAEPTEAEVEQTGRGATAEEIKQWNAGDADAANPDSTRSIKSLDSF
jgi:hypothetical protein